MKLSAASVLLLAAMWLLSVALDPSSTAPAMLCGFGAGTAAYWSVVLIASHCGRGRR